MPASETGVVEAQEEEPAYAHSEPTAASVFAHHDDEHDDED
jgi:hypothetical protein